MAATFHSINQATGVIASPTVAVMTPSPPTPRSNTAPEVDSINKPDDASMPTRTAYTSPTNGQKPLPKNAFPQAVQIPESTDKAKTDSPHQTPQSQTRDSMEMDVDESDGEPGEGGDDAGSDDGSISADGTRSNKKKKSQRFYCTEFPPCNLSFTRSEHLARHIRKHTGERPFQCHCSRRFSRLDNLRQHAQTVHVNEDIPIDSLAATGSRFQRQIRTDRVRAAGNRARVSTGGSAGGPARGHSKSLSTSSINSISSVGSTYSVHADARRRPPPLVMAADPRARPAVDPYRVDGAYYGPPSSEYGTPTSATFSTGQTSPRWNPGMASPTLSHSRSHSMYSVGARTPGRRLSVPSGANPFQSPHGVALGRPIFAPGPVNASNNGAFSPPGSSLVSSPTTSSGWSARRDSVSSVSDDPWRRRTWHPDSRGGFGQPRQLNTVTSHASPNPPPPMAEPSKPQPGLRLPGIESFGPIPRPPRTPPRRSSPMKVDSEPRMRMPVGLEGSPAERPRNANLYEPNLQRGLNRLELEHNPSRESPSAWASEVTKAVHEQADQVRMNPTVRFQEPPHAAYHNAPVMASRSLHQQTMSAPSFASSRDNRRHGWYNGPARDSPGSQQPSGPDPRAAHVDRMEHPNMTAFSGFPNREQQPPQPPPERNGNADPLGRLEALVAVATSEGSTATAY